MRNKIRRNLYLSVDFEREKTLGGLFLNKRHFYLIGTLPAVIIQENGKKEIAKLKCKIEIPGNDAQLRNILGIKASDDHTAKKYQTEIQEMVIRLEKLINRIMETKVFAGKPLKQLAIVNFG